MLIYFIFLIINFLIKDRVSEWKNENGCVVDVSVDVDAYAPPSPYVDKRSVFVLNLR